MHAHSSLRRARFAIPRLAGRGLIDLAVAVDARFRQRTDMKALDDRMLSDIGVTRADVDRELRRPILW